MQAKSFFCLQTISNLLKTTSEHLFYAKGTGYESKEDKKQKTGKENIICDSFYAHRCISAQSKHTEYKSKLER